MLEDEEKCLSLLDVLSLMLLLAVLLVNDGFGIRVLCLALVVTVAVLDDVNDIDKDASRVSNIED